MEISQFVCIAKTSTDDIKNDKQQLDMQTGKVMLYTVFGCQYQW